MPDNVTHQNQRKPINDYGLLSIIMLKYTGLIFTPNNRHPIADERLGQTQTSRIKLTSILSQDGNYNRIKHIAVHGCRNRETGGTQWTRPLKIGKRGTIILMFPCRYDSSGSF
jgi:hypothetical protein